MDDERIWLTSTASGGLVGEDAVHHMDDERIWLTSTASGGLVGEDDPTGVDPSIPTRFE
jgi:hypothetical protein